MLRCPVCGTPMREIERFGVMIDICPSCKGVWLDRGELDKIIRYAQTGYGDEVMAEGGYESTAYEQSPTPPLNRPTPYPQQPYPQQPQQQYPQQYQPHPKQKKRRFFEFLEDLFELGD